MVAEPGGRALPDGPDRRRALLVLTRDPTGRVSGRKTVLETAAASLEHLGYAVHAVVLARTPPEVATWRGRPLHAVPLPPLARSASSAVRVLVRGGGTLNESLFDSPSVRRAVADVARRLRPDLVVADGLRTAGPSLALGLPVLVHLDDLLSDRYADGAADAGTDVLGFFADQLPGPARPAAAATARRLLAVESRRAAVREVEVARSATAVAMTSAGEAAELSRRAGRPVAALPMAVQVRPAGDPAEAEATSVVFLGLLDYRPNRVAVQWWTDHVRPALDALGGGDVRLTVVGHRTSRLEGADEERLRFTGYVEALGAELRKHRAMVVPVRSGAGVKTKVLDAWSVGLPVVATRAGAAGLDPEAGGLVLADSAADFAAAVVRLRDDPALAAATGARGRHLLERDWSPAALAERWRESVAPLQP